MRVTAKAITYSFSSVIIGVLLVSQLTIYFAPHPGITPDELTYLRQSFYFDSDQVGFGNPIHSLLYSNALACSDSWYQCVKSLNLLFDLIFAASLSFYFWWVTRSPFLTAGIFLALWFGPFVMFGQYFMPDSMLAAFVAVFFVCLSLLWHKPWLAAVVAGPILGSAMLVKPHAFFIFLGLVALTGILSVLKRGRTNFSIGTKPLVFALMIALGVRSSIGVFIYGLPGLNPLAQYFSFASLIELFDDTSATSVLSESETEVSFEPLVSGFLSFLVNMAPGLFLLSFLLLSFLFVCNCDLRVLFRDRAVIIALGIFLSLLLMTAGFGALLELRAAEDTIYRTMTRYWEYAGGILLVAFMAHAWKHRDQNLPRDYKTLVFVGSVFLLTGLGVLTIPKSQTASDSALLFSGFLVVVAILFGTAILMALMSKRNPALVSAFVVLAMVGLGGFSQLRYFDFSIAEKSGAVLGYELVEILKIHPTDVNRIMFIGETSAANTASFIARLESTNRLPSNFYESFRESDIAGSPRWVAASKEVFVKGDIVDSKILGDMVLYEFGYPAELSPIDFSKYEVNYSGTFLHTYWGSWVSGKSFSFTVPEDLSGNTIAINLLVNDELEETQISIDFGEGPVIGSIEPGQVLTPVTLQKDGEANWSGTEIRVTYLGEANEIFETRKKLAMGFGGFSVYNSK